VFVDVKPELRRLRRRCARPAAPLRREGDRNHQTGERRRDQWLHPAPPPEAPRLPGTARVKSYRRRVDLRHTDCMAGDMIYRTLGRTGERVSASGLGGWHLSLPAVDETLAIRIIRTAIDRGITFLDNSWDYNGGASETRMGKALRDGFRHRVFL